MDPLFDTSIFYTPGAVTPRPKRRPADYLPDEEEESMLAALARNTGSAVEFLGKTLDTPGAIARGVLAGDPLSGFSWDSDRRVTGEELLDSYGLLNNVTNPYARTLAGFATEVATDPLAWVSGPMGALTKGGKAAKAANLLDSAPIIAQRRMGADAARTLTGRFTDDALAKVLPDNLAKNAANYAVRPLVGPRLARATTTLDEVVKGADDPTAAMDKVLKYLSTTGTKYDEVANQKLGGMFGLGFMSPVAAVTPPGGEKLLDAMDMLGQRVAWSAPVRYGSALFDKRVDGQTSAADQLAALRRNAMTDAAQETGRRKAVQHAMTISEIPVSKEAAELLGANTLLSREGNEFLTRLFENKPTALDNEIAARLPGIQKAYESWDALRSSNITEAARLGMRVNKYGDRYGVLYSPRSGSEFDFGEMGRGVGKALFNTSTAEHYSRQPYLITPGGTSDLREVSLLPMVREHAMKGDASPYTNEQVGQHIAEYLRNKHPNTPYPTSDSQGTAIARVMKRINKDLPADYPVFAEHPINAQARNIINQEVARANANFIYDSIAEAVINRGPNELAGGGYRPLNQAINDVASRVGLQTGRQTGGAAPAVKRNVLDRVAQRLGVDPTTLDINQMTLPESVFNRLVKVHDFYTNPRAQEEVGTLLNKFTSVMKGFLLAWGSRHLRDMYSNAISSWLETGSVNDTLTGFSAAKAIIRGDFDKAVPLLSKLPQYAGIADGEALKRKFMEDAGGTGVLSTLATSDLLTASNAGDIDQLVPGVSKISRLGAMKELLPDGSRNPLQMAGDFFTIRNVTSDYKTLNPVLNASQKLGDVNDSIARLGTYIALLKQGVDPSQAAARVREALVDYSSLTTVERNLFRNIFPWWAYNSRIGKYVVQNLLERPGGRYGQAIRGMNTLQATSEDTYIPTALRQQFAIRVPDALKPYLGMDPKTGTDTYIRNFDWPGIDVPISLIAPGDLQGTFSNIFQQTHPLIRTAAEYGTNTDFFSKRPLDEAVTPLDRIYQQAFGTKTRLNPLAKAVVNNIPGLQRPISLFGGLADQRLPLQQRVIKQVFNNTTGLAQQDVDEQYKWSDAKAKNASQDRGWRSTYTMEFIPEELLPEVPPDVLKRHYLDKELDRRLREAKKAKAPPEPKKKQKKRANSGVEEFGL